MAHARQNDLGHNFWMSCLGPYRVAGIWCPIVVRFFYLSSASIVPASLSTIRDFDENMFLYNPPTSIAQDRFV